MRTQFNNWNKDLVKESTFFKYRYVNKKSNTSTSWKLHPVYFHILFIAILAICIYSVYALSGRIKFSNLHDVGEKLKRLFSFGNKYTERTGRFDGKYENLLLETMKVLWVTIKLALTGTFIGFVLALVTAYFSFATPTNKYSAFLVFVIMLILRSIPELVFIQIFILSIQNELSLLLVYIWFTWLWLHKYYEELLVSVDLEAYKISLMQGNSKTKAFFKEIYPRVKNRIIALFIFSFESNMRWASILGALTLPGIGKLIYYASHNITFFNELGIPLLVLMVFVLLLEVLNYVFKRFLFEARTKVILPTKNEDKISYYKRLSKKINIRRVIIVLIFMLFAVVSITTFATTRIKIHNLDVTKKFFEQIFNPDFSHFSFKSTDVNHNPLLLIWNSLQFSFASLFICIVLTLIAIRLQSLNLNRLYVAATARSLNVLVRLVPTTVLFYTFFNIFPSPITLLMLVVGIHQMCSKSKQLTEVVDNLDIEAINNMRMQGYTNNQIFLKYVLPAIKVDFISMTIFYFELIFRNSITYYVLASQELHIGRNISRYLDTRLYQPRVALSYVWLSCFSILLINIIGRLVIKRVKK
ncbi:ABC transport system permease protein p69 [Mycoplasmopsis agalactiae]|uniref:Alkylphosphonate ABC transporter, permeaseprotein n=1 Tax=Mycoplasmopsis agalactiae (strain NCTC 10123 / CIP 59.7 / PG2) TaxID=347257 RepID=A5IY60_MYCAP|nr:ABC transporter permease subunit [Mycoplasmopsis agalactiae]MCE6057042.1 ABC transporter permease subunit [Mycoplasmopsis agalactiae]MCE6078828.1 ABC transporter permease subunit [Mycoplasmopsis agalactiae]MCE6095212.1 ABC transporter permease subunit [Mycoplasmopsis agalactiae]MCE6114468.1 ABC transporter permease subunit [Mycoplasmopsis agalactiae]NLS34303.1 ABC transporter permease subunit [Mycoplasmopsis agalactiae]